METTNSYTEVIQDTFDTHEIATKSTKVKCSATLQEIALTCVSSLINKKKIIWLGNGGSAADCQHLAAELVGRFTRERSALASVALTVDSSILTAIANDYGFDFVFSRQIEALAQPGDVVIGISTSGNSTNVLNAMQTAKSLDCKTIAFTGQTGGELAGRCDIALKIPTSVTARIQEMHILCGHILCDIIESELSLMRDETK